MSEGYFLYIADISQSFVLIISLAAYIPQWNQLYREKDSSSLSLKAWSLWLVSSVLAWFYSAVQVVVYGTGHALLLTSSLSLIFLLVTVIMIFRYRSVKSLASADHQIA